MSAAVEVHEQLGPGLFEAMYMRCLAAELQLRGFDVAVEVPIRARYKHVDLDLAYRLDIVVGGAVVVEVKAIRQLTEVHHAQLLTYLRATNRAVGLLLNFNVPLMKRGIKRVYNTRALPVPRSSPVPPLSNRRSAEPPPTTSPSDAHRSA